MLNDTVIPVIISNVNWTKYLEFAQEKLGHNPARGVDASPSRLSDFAKFTASLAEFKLREELVAKQTLRTPGPWLKHTFYGFLIQTTNQTMLELSESTSLGVLSSQSVEKGFRAAVVSGTLEQWREAVIVCCGPGVKERLRRLFNQIKFLFDQLGLSDVWFGYTVVNLADATFTLEYEP